MNNRSRHNHSWGTPTLWYRFWQVLGLLGWLIFWLIVSVVINWDQPGASLPAAAGNTAAERDALAGVVRVADKVPLRAGGFLSRERREAGIWKIDNN